MAQATMSQTAASRKTAESTNGQDKPRDLADHLMEYANENPTQCAMWCFFAGFVLGWRLKPW